MQNNWPLLLKAAFKRTQKQVSLRSVPPILPHNKPVAHHADLNAERWAPFHRVVDWQHRQTLHPCVPHVLAFSQHLALMLQKDFPFALLGLVHLRNRIVQHRPLESGIALRLESQFGECVRHPKGWLFTIHSRAYSGDKCVWEGESDNLYRVRLPEDIHHCDVYEAPSLLSADAQIWTLPENLGRQYAVVSGDYNLIHIHPVLARLFGFQRAIAHGMWSKARCLSEALNDGNGAFRVDGAFHKPISLPDEIRYAQAEVSGQLHQQLQSAAGDKLHLDARFEHF